MDSLSAMEIQQVMFAGLFKAILTYLILPICAAIIAGLTLSFILSRKNIRALVEGLKAELQNKPTFKDLKESVNRAHAEREKADKELEKTDKELEKADKELHGRITDETRELRSAVDAQSKDLGVIHSNVQWIKGFLSKKEDDDAQ